MRSFSYFWKISFLHFKNFPFLEFLNCRKLLRQPLVDLSNSKTTAIRLEIPQWMIFMCSGLVIMHLTSQSASKWSRSIINRSRALEFCKIKNFCGPSNQVPGRRKTPSFASISPSHQNFNSSLNDYYTCHAAHKHWLRR